MSRTTLVLLAVVALVSLAQFASARVATHVDRRLIPARSRRRVTWMLANTMHIQETCGVLVAALLAVQVALALQ